MKIMKKLCMILSFVFVIGALCIAEPASCGAWELDDDDYGIAVGSVKYDWYTWNNLYGDSVSYNEGTNTLYLTDATIHGFSGIDYGYCSREDKDRTFTIVLKGKNVIETDDMNGNGSVYGIRSRHFSSAEATKCVIKGNGSLDIIIHNTDGYGAGIVAAGGMVIKGKASVNITMDDEVGYSAICVDNEHSKRVKLDGSAKMTVYSPKSAFYKDAPVFGKKYIPSVKAGESADEIAVEKKKPSQNVYTKYKYVSISKSK